jgi:RNA 3'-terminal phosphate cyclase (ATP)
MTVMLKIDGSQGEGGGQILRSSLALSLATGTPFELSRIRAGRKKPGLLRQHLVCVQAAATMSGADVTGDELRSTRLTFAPGPLRPGDYEFVVSTAGSACLVLQAVLPALVTGPGPFELTLGGGTHNPFAPPFDFLDRVFLPVLARLGAKVSIDLDRPGFYPAGGGRMRARIEPVERLGPLEILERGQTRRRKATVLQAHVPKHVAERELRAIGRRLGWAENEMEIVTIEDSAGPGNVLLLEIESEGATELATGFGVAGVRAETVAERALTSIREYIALDAPVGRHLADQLLLPMALGSGGSFRTGPLTRHCATNIEIIRQFLDVDIRSEPLEDGTVRVAVRSRH